MPKKPEAVIYQDAVIKGKIPAGKYVRLACDRNKKDLERQKKRNFPYKFVQKDAEHAIEFFSYLRHSKGEWAGTQFTLSPYQKFIVWVVFGWRQKADPTIRRFRVAYNELPRKNGKTTFAAGVGNYLFIADGEPGAEVYVAATKRDQAKIAHGEATRMVQSSPYLRKLVGVFKNNLHIAETASKFEPLGADEDTMDGLNVHGAIIDELHAHKTRGIWDVLETATGARRQPLTFAITTAGFDRHSICWEQHLYAQKILEGIIEDETYFAFIAGIDEGDDWADEKVWAKANPNIGISVKIDDLRRKAEKAKEIPAAQNAFRRLHLNEWTEQSERWIDMTLWDACAEPFDLATLEGRECFGGLDLATTTDIAAWAKLFPPTDEDELWRLLVSFFVPADNVEQRSRKDKVPYDQWIKAGLIHATEGNVIDYDFIREAIHEDADRYRITEIAYDRWNANQIVTQLQGDGLTMVPFGLGFASMAAPTREFELLLKGRKIAHGGNPVLRWMASNTATKQDPAGNRKPDKAKSSEKIDGIVASILALGRAIVTDSSESVYANEDERVFFDTE
jgi:phage terminase large subunit-like protein